jgi:hypothetical protein
LNQNPIFEMGSKSIADFGFRIEDCAMGAKRMAHSAKDLN